MPWPILFILVMLSVLSARRWSVLAADLAWWSSLTVDLHRERSLYQELGKCVHPGNDVVVVYLILFVVAHLLCFVPGNRLEAATTN